MPASPTILLIKLSSLGDVIHALPTLEALRDLYPGGRFTWLVEEPYAPLLIGHPALNQVLLVPRLRLRQKWRLTEITAFLALVRDLQARPFDLVIDLQGLLKSALWVALANSPRKLGFDGSREMSYLVLTERLPKYDPNLHAAARYLQVAAYLGAQDISPRFRLPPQLSGDISSVLAPAAGRPVVILHPGARWPSKLWPPAHWAALACWLKDKGALVVITGSPADRGLTAAIMAQVRGEVLNLTGQTTLGTLTALLKVATLAVTTDTGPLHLAAALGTRVVALFGPTAPWRTGPYGAGHKVLRLALSCSPCFQRRCPLYKEPHCLTQLAPEVVLSASEKILASS